MSSDNEPVTKGELREILVEFKAELLAVILPELRYNRTLYEMILDDIRPNWRGEVEAPVSS